MNLKIKENFRQGVYVSLTNGGDKLIKADDFGVNEGGDLFLYNVVGDAGETKTVAIFSDGTWISALRAETGEEEQ